jgi:hypothetical protein
MIKRIVSPLLLLAVLGGCADPFLGSRDEDADVAAQRRRWEAQKLDDYRFRFARTCFCYEIGQVIVEVRNDRVVAVRDARTGAPLSTEQAHGIPTIEKLFDEIAEAKRDGTYLEVTYHPSRGYPQEATIGTLANDAGVRYSVSDVQPR